MDNYDELLEIVDENNQSLKIFKERGLVHDEDKDWHRTTAIWIVNHEKQVLCQKANPEKYSRNKDKWYSNFGGHIAKGQSYLENAVEELKEEIGLVVKKKNLNLVDIRKSGPKYKHFIVTYVLWWNGNLSELQFLDKEVVEVCWFSLSQLREMKESGILDNSIPEKVVEYINKN